MNETELKEAFEGLTRHPEPSRYELGSVQRAVRRKRQRFQLVGVIGCTIVAIALGVLVVGKGSEDNPRPNILLPAAGFTLNGEWLLTGLNDADHRPVTGLPTRPDLVTRLAFDRGHLTVEGTCNLFTATYRQSGSRGQVLRFPADSFLPRHPRQERCGHTTLRSRLLDVRYIGGSNDLVHLYDKAGSVVAQLTRDPVTTATHKTDSASLRQLCGGPGIATFVNYFEPDQATGSADAAARRWAGSEPLSVLETTRSDLLLARVGMSHGMPRFIMTLEKTSNGWVVWKTTACLSEVGSGIKCEQTLSYGSRTYTVEPRPAGVVTGVGRPLGQGEMEGCISAGSKRLSMVGVVAPVSVYQANEASTKDEVVISQKPGTKVFTTHTHASSTGPWPQGIFDDREAPTSGSNFLGQNRWVGTFHGNSVAVYAGQAGFDRDTGRVLVMFATPSGGVDSGFTLDLAGSGPLRVVAASGVLVTFVDRAGKKHVLNLSKRSWEK